MMYWGDHGWGMSFFMIVFWVLVVLGVVYVFQLLGRRAGRSSQDDPLEIAKKRYAKGDISKEEFERMKDDLKKA